MSSVVESVIPRTGAGVAVRSQAHAHARAPAAYMNPYLAGIGLGLVLLAAYVVKPSRPAAST